MGQVRRKDGASLNGTNARCDQEAVGAAVALATQGQAAQFEAFPGLGVVQKVDWDAISFWQSVDGELARLGMTRADLEADQ